MNTIEQVDICTSEISEIKFCESLRTLRGAFSLIEGLQNDVVGSGDPVVLHWSRHVTGTGLTKFWSNSLGQVEAYNGRNGSGDQWVEVERISGGKHLRPKVLQDSHEW